MYNMTSEAIPVFFTKSILPAIYGGKHFKFVYDDRKESCGCLNCLLKACNGLEFLDTRIIMAPLGIKWSQDCCTGTCFLTNILAAVNVLLNFDDLEIIMEF